VLHRQAVLEQVDRSEPVDGDAARDRNASLLSVVIA
jgi:hypothetical protein